MKYEKYVKLQSSTYNSSAQVLLWPSRAPMYSGLSRDV